MTAPEDQHDRPSPTERVSGVPTAPLLAREIAAYRQMTNGAEMAMKVLENSGLLNAAASMLTFDSEQRRAIERTIEAATGAQSAAVLATRHAAIKSMLDGLPAMNKTVSQMLAQKLPGMSMMTGLNESAMLQASISAMQDAQELMSRRLPAFDYAAAAARFATVSSFVDELELDEDEVEAELAPVIDVESFVDRDDVGLTKVLDLQDPKVRRTIVFAVQAAVYLAIVGTIAANPTLITVATTLFALLGVNPKVIGELTGKAAQAALDKYAPLKSDGTEE